jgi:hypothetical protein
MEVYEVLRTTSSHIFQRHFVFSVMPALTSNAS